MCGIAGWVTNGNKSLYGAEMDMVGMSAALAPRGPDESGIWKSHSCFFAHRRLVVIDRENGKQPMRRFKGDKSEQQYVICYNGELYNTDEIRRELGGLGYTFTGHSDTEVLLTAYMEWGPESLQKLNGIYAFAVWNEQTKELFLARDRIGVKPLFYSQKGADLVFASEIKALLAHRNVSRSITREGLLSIAMLGPARIPGTAVYKDIQELLPGEFLIWRGGEIVRRESYWRLTAKEHTETYEQTREHVRELLSDAIERQLVSDVPLCTFLSGGLDSSVITAIAARKFAGRGETLSTWSVDYKNNRKNFKKSVFQPDEDAPWIVRMSGFAGTDHTNVELDTAELVSALYDAAKARDLPGMADVDSSLLLFCKKVKERFPVAVSGECADELFAGYPWYHNEEILFQSGFPWARSTDERAGILLPDISDNSKRYVADACDMTVRSGDYLPGESAKNRRQREMFLLNFYWFMQVLLERKDRMSMACGLEVRVPFCDHRIAEYAYNIPWEFKSRGGREKGLIRDAMTGLLPDDVLWRKKSPYPKTHNPDYLAAVTAKLSEVIEKPDCPLFEIWDKNKLKEICATGGNSFRQNWFGQLMSAPQTISYFLQTHYLLR